MIIIYLNSIGSSDQIGELQSNGVHLLIRKDDVERQGAAEPISAITEASEFQFELVVFFLASAFHNHMGQPVLLPFLLHKLKKCLQAEAERQVIRIGVQAAVLDPQLLLVHYRADEDEVALFNQAVQLFDELPFRSAMGELEIPLLLTDLMLVQHHKVMAEVVKLELVERGYHFFAVVLLVENTKAENKDGISRVQRLHAMVAAFIDIDDEIAELTRRTGRPFGGRRILPCKQRKLRAHPHHGYLTAFKRQYSPPAAHSFQ